ncbi:gastrula zinc finger protein XlCGF7.1-like isoform X2 [Amyelois transitella]|uniref:gastrula zinc finger protein XlCGF7.1-like isoform X2 n=1 Tax=Amyelois transitella TaxID=680683 RepID=UPI00298FE5B4|nr:gastrula zinc finger protein XlCGF7.1-like isoform X2 [Amyelois transitella]
MDKCGICEKPASQLFETGREGVYACFKCQPLVPEVTLEDNAETGTETNMVEIEVEATSAEKALQLQNHLRNHRAERRFVCTFCSKAFSQSNNLRAHLRIHTNERPFKCTECGKAFTQVTNLNNHVRLHTGERPFVCPEAGCNKAYAQVTNLNQHRKRHLNGRPVENTYDCNICGEQFQQRNHMYTHRREVHPKASNPPVRQRHVCSLCDAVLPSEKLLLRHVNHHVEQNNEKESGDQKADEGSLPCVFPSCGARLPSARAHTEHLLRAHQLRVLAAAAPRRRGRPPKVSQKQEMEVDPLEITDSDFTQVKSMKVQFLPKLKIQSLFQ